jgi:alpha-D-xyloside xylohydrolase
MLGDELLVAPVTKPGEHPGKRVWFPPGDWVDVFTGKVHHGPRAQNLSVPLGRMPVFARAGSIVPRRPYESNIGTGPSDPLVLDVYAGADGHFDLYEDAGEGFAYQNGGFARTDLRWHQDGNDATVAIGRSRGRYSGMPAKRRYVLRISGVDRPSGITETTAGRTRRLGGWEYDPVTNRLEVPTGAIGARAGGTIGFDFSAPRRHRHGHRRDH